MTAPLPPSDDAGDPGDPRDKAHPATAHRTSPIEPSAPAAPATPVAPPAPVASRLAWALRFAVALALVAGLLACLLRHADLAAMARTAAALPAGVWVAGAAGLMMTYALRAWRLRAEWSRLHAAGFAECLQIFLTHNAALALLPMRSGEAGYLWLLNRRWGVPWADAARSLLWLRLQDAFVLGVLAVGFLVPAPAPLRAAAAAAIVLLTATLAPAGLRRAGRRWPAVQRAASALLDHRADATGWACCIGNWIVKLATLGGLLWALLHTASAGVPIGAGGAAGKSGAIGPLGAWCGALGGELAGALPLQGPAGLGTYEAGVWAGAKLALAQAPQIAAAALTVHAFSLAVALASAALARAVITTPAEGQSRP